MNIAEAAISDLRSCLAVIKYLRAKDTSIRSILLAPSAWEQIRVDIANTPSTEQCGYTYINPRILYVGGIHLVKRIDS